MDRAVVRSIQTFCTVFLVLAVFTASGRALLAVDADHTAAGLISDAIGIFLVLFVGLGLIWVLPDRAMRGVTTARKLRPNASTRGASGNPTAPEAAGDGADAVPIVGASPSATAIVAAGADSRIRRKTWSAEGRLFIAIVPALLILLVGVALYLR